MSTSSLVPSVKHIASNLAISLDFLRDFVEVHLDADVFDLLYQHA